MIYLNLAAPTFRKIKRRIKMEKLNHSGKGLVSNLAKTGFELRTKALGSEFGKK